MAGGHNNAQNKREEDDVAYAPAGSGSRKDDEEERKMHSAAGLLQKHYRGHRSVREAAGLNLEKSRGISGKARTKSPSRGSHGKPAATNGHEQQQGSSTPGNSNEPMSSDTRWDDAFNSGGLNAASKEQARGQNDAKSRWQRTGFYAERITGSDGAEGEDGDQDSGVDAGSKAKALAPNKQMEAQYWLEIVDSKHRYGTNLKSYHDEWNKSDTDQNFFHWLDHGDGKNLDLKACSRAQLDKECVTYLSSDQRKNYLVDVGRDGLLCWRRNGRKVDTKKHRWEDLGGGRGIGYKGEKDNLPAPQEHNEDDNDDSSPSEASSDYSSGESEGAQTQFKQKHYHSKPDEEESKHKYWTSPSAIMDVLLRKTINANTWIYVCTTEGELYVGIKATGGFQHSSFMYGATVASAGLLKVKNGQLTSLSPLSGHYRAGTVHFKAFCETLRKKGVDMSGVSISKSLFVIGGIEKYARFSSKKKKAKTGLREKLHLPPNQADKKQIEEDERNEKIEEEARQKEKAGDTSRLPGHKDSPGENGTEKEGHAESKKPGAVEGDMHEGKRVEDLTEEQRVQRAIALIRSAMSKGKEGEEKKVEQDGEGSDPQAQARVNGESQAQPKDQPRQNQRNQPNQHNTNVHN